MTDTPKPPEAQAKQCCFPCCGCICHVQRVERLENWIKENTDPITAREAIRYAKAKDWR